jgi:hypothetical protein
MRITAEDLIAVLGYASGNRVSMDTACQELKEAPSVNRLREVLATALPDRATRPRHTATCVEQNSSLANTAHGEERKTLVLHRHR